MFTFYPKYVGAVLHIIDDALLVWGCIHRSTVCIMKEVIVMLPMSVQVLCYIWDQNFERNMNKV